jgi:hypothetical protein
MKNKKSKVIVGKSYNEILTELKITPNKIPDIKYHTYPPGLLKFTTIQAFKQLVFTPSVWKTLDIPAARILYFRNRIKNGKTVEIETIEKLLLKAGYKIVQEKSWSK